MTMTAANTWNNKFIDLSARAKQITSQYQTDGVIEAIFELCLPENRYCVELGAFDGFHYSNTWSLIQNGWKSLQIEGSAGRGEEGAYQLLQKTYQDNPEVICHQAIVRPDHFGYEDEFSQILSKYSVPSHLDFLSIDVDSYDYEIWRSLLSEYRPNLVIIECNQVEDDFDIINYDPSYSVKELRLEGNYNPIRYGGATVGLLNKLAEFKGYELVCVDNHDAIYIEKKFAKPLEKYD